MKLLRKIIVVILALIAANVYPVTIYLRKTGYAHGNYIELSEIAYIDGENREIFAKIILGKTSKRPFTLTADKIKQAIDATRYSSLGYTIIGDKCRVTTPMTKITFFEIETEIKKAVKKLFPANWRSTYILFTQEVRDVIIPLGNYKIYVDVKNADSLYGRKELLVRVFLDNRLYTKVNTSVIIQGRVRVMYARRAIYPGKRLTRSDVFFNEIMLQKNLSRFVFSLDELRGFVASKYIPAGGPVLKDAIKKKVIVKNGEPVELLYKHGTVVMYLEGVAMDNGGLGDIIAVKSKFREKLLKGRIIGGGRIEILK